MLFLRQIINATDTKTFLAIGPSWVCLHLNFTLGERPLDRVVCDLMQRNVLISLRCTCRVSGRFESRRRVPQIENKRTNGETNA